jgi:hypothetical protein
MRFHIPPKTWLRLGLLAAALAPCGGCAFCPAPPILRPIISWSPLRYQPCFRTRETGALFGHHGTCWSPWPPGWVPCPEQQCAAPLLDAPAPAALPEAMEDIGAPLLPTPQPGEPLPEPPPAEPAPGDAPPAVPPGAPPPEIESGRLLDHSTQQYAVAEPLFRPYPIDSRPVVRPVHWWTPGSSR